MIDKFRLDKRSQTGLAFFYCDYRDTESHTAANIIASLIKQLCSSLPNLPHSLSRLYMESDNGQNMPKVEELREVLNDTCRNSQDVYIIIDALDECDALRHRPVLVKTLERIQRDVAKVFVTSRPYPDDIKKAFAHGLQIQISAQEFDIRMYLEAKIF